MTRPIALLFVLFLATPAHADVVVPHYRVQPVATVHLSGVRRVSTDAPTEDAEAVLRETRSQLYGAQARIDRCMRGVDLREDPLRSRSRSLSGTLVFTRSGRPTVEIDRVRGLPSGARACVEEAVRSIAVRTAPRGRVEVRFTYSLR